MSTLREGLKDVVPKLGLKVNEVPESGQAPMGDDILDVEVLDERKEALGNASKSIYRTISAKFERPTPFSYKRKCGKPRVLEVSKVLEKVRKDGLSYQTLDCLHRLSRHEDGEKRFIPIGEIEAFIRRESGIPNEKIKSKTVDSFLSFFRKAGIVGQETNPEGGRSYCFLGAGGVVDTNVAYIAYLDSIRKPKKGEKAARVKKIVNDFVRDEQGDTVSRQEFDEYKKIVHEQIHEVLSLYEELREGLREDVIRRHGLTPNEISLITFGARKE